MQFIYILGYLCLAVSVVSCSVDSKISKSSEFQEGQMRMFDSFSCPSSNMVVSFHSQTFHGSCRAEHSSCFKPWPMRQFKLLWKQLALFGSLLYIYIFVDFKPEHKPHPRSAATNLTGCTTQMFITPTYRETNQQPNLQQAVALLTFTAQCFSYPSSFSFFFSRLSKPTTF